MVCQDNDACISASGYKVGISRSAQSKELDWDTFSSSKSLGLYIKSLLDRTSTKYHEGFVIIRCNKSVTSDTESDPVQLLLLPPRLERVSSTSRSHLNVQLVLLQETSREKVFRELQETVKLMRELNTGGASRTEVLDFSRIQDLGEGRNLAALMSGNVKEEAPDSLLRKFSSSQHQTIWQHGQCPSNPSPHLTSLGVSRAFCHLTDLPDHLTAGLLLSAAELQDEVLSSGHYSHLQVLTLPPLNTHSDSSLRTYLQSLASHSHTVTLLTSLSSPDPTSPLPLFLFIPHRVKSLLSESSWQSLLTNQPRLLSLLDLYPSLSSLASLSHQDSGISSPGLLSSLPGRECGLLPRAQFDCLCRPHQTRLEEDQLRTGLGEVITQLHNLQLTRDTQTVCARRTMAEVIQADIQTYPQDEKTYRLVAVVLLVTDSQEEDTETVISGSVDLHLEAGTLRLEQKRLKTDRQSLVFGCLQQYSTGEENRRTVTEYVSRERSAGSTVQNIFNENSVDCLWLVTRHIGDKVQLVELASACLEDVEVFIELRPGEKTLSWRRGEHKTVMSSGENSLINVCMTGLGEASLPECQTTLVNIRYLDGGDYDDANK